MTLFFHRSKQLQIWYRHTLCGPKGHIKILGKSIVIFVIMFLMTLYARKSSAELTTNMKIALDHVRLHLGHMIDGVIRTK